MALPEDVSKMLSERVGGLRSSKVGFDPAEQRMTTRLFNYWQSLRQNLAFPSRSSFSVEAVDGLAEFGFSMALEANGATPTFHFVGNKVRKLINVDPRGMTVSEFQPGTLFGTVARHSLKVLDCKAPIGLDDNHIDSDGRFYKFRAILLPFGEDGQCVNFIVGALTYEEMLSQTTIAGQLDREVPAGSEAHASVIEYLEKRIKATSDLWRSEDESTDGSETDLPITGHDFRSNTHKGHEGTGLDRKFQQDLAECRRLAFDFQSASVKSRDVLYQTLERTYQFHLDTLADPDALEGLYISSGIKVQKRSHFTALVKLVFGGDHDKTRVSEYATCLAYAKRKNTEAGCLQSLLGSLEGGIKGCVKAEREARRREQHQANDILTKSQDALRRLQPLADLKDRTSKEQEFVLLLARRVTEDGRRLKVLSILDEKASVIEPILKRAARKLSQ